MLFGQGNLMAVYIIQTLIGTITIYYIYKLSVELIGYNKSLLVLFWAGFYINYFRYLNFLARENLIFLLLTLVFYFLWKLINNDRKTHLIRSNNFWLFTILINILIHTDARYLFFIPFLIIIFCHYFGLYQ